MTFEVLQNGRVVKEHTMLLNPEEYTQREVSRGEVVHTFGGLYVEDWGRGMTEITLRGTTGYGARTDVRGRETDGYQAFKDLRGDVFRYFLQPEMEQKQNISNVYQLKFYNWEDDEYFFIYPRAFSLNRSVSRPLLYVYDFSFYCLEELTKAKTIPAPAPVSISSARKGLQASNAQARKLFEF